MAKYYPPEVIQFTQLAEGQIQMQTGEILSRSTRRPAKNNTTDYSGVSRVKVGEREKYIAYVSVQKQQTRFGPFKTSVEAALVHDGAIRHYGLSRRQLNFLTAVEADAEAEAAELAAKSTKNARRGRRLAAEKKPRKLKPLLDDPAPGKFFATISETEAFKQLDERRQLLLKARFGENASNKKLREIAKVDGDAGVRYLLTTALEVVLSEPSVRQYESVESVMQLGMQNRRSAAQRARREEKSSDPKREVKYITRRSPGEGGKQKTKVEKRQTAIKDATPASFFAEISETSAFKTLPQEAQYLFNRYYNDQTTTQRSLAAEMGIPANSFSMVHTMLVAAIKDLWDELPEHLRTRYVSSEDILLLRTGKRTESTRRIMGRLQTEKYVKKWEKREPQTITPDQNN